MDALFRDMILLLIGVVVPPAKIIEEVLILDP
jgi:hypothetical protein